MARPRRIRRLGHVHPPPGTKVVLTGKTDYVAEIARLFAAEGLAPHTGPLPGGGWGTHAWLAVAGRDQERAQALFQEHQDSMVRREGLPVCNTAADFDAPETECPACQAKFATAGTDRCPSCGLRFR